MANHLLLVKHKSRTMMKPELIAKQNKRQRIYSNGKGMKGHRQCSGAIIYKQQNIVLMSCVIPIKKAIFAAFKKVLANKQVDCTTNSPLYAVHLFVDRSLVCFIRIQNFRCLLEFIDWETE